MKEWRTFQFTVGNLNNCLNNLEREGWIIFAAMKHGAQKVLIIAYKEIS